MPAPPFGTASAYTDSFPSPPPREITISSETCFNLSVFKDMMKQYRKLDDQIIVRLNRAQAQLRDSNRLSSPSSSSSSSGSEIWRSGGSKEVEDAEGMCLKMWAEMMAGWAHRQTLLTYCLNTVNSSLEAKKAEVKGMEERLTASSSNTNNRIIGRGLKEEEVLANQLDNEHSVEAIIRKRTLDAFKSRCPYFSPPPDNTSKAWWDLADSGRSGRGPDIPWSGFRQGPGSGV